MFRCNRRIHRVRPQPGDRNHHCRLAAAAAAVVVVVVDAVVDAVAVEARKRIGENTDRTTDSYQAMPYVLHKALAATIRRHLLE